MTFSGYYKVDLSGMTLEDSVSKPDMTYDLLRSWRVDLLEFS
jgi:hypothetical protein